MGTPIFLLIVLIFYLLPFPVALSDKDDQLSFICLSTTKNFDADFQQSRLYVLDALVGHAPKNKNGFYYTAQVENHIPAYGLAQCRGGLSQQDCDKCLSQAVLDLASTYCPKSDSAIIWRIHCMLKYSDVDFLGKLDTVTSSSNHLPIFGKYTNIRSVNALMSIVIYEAPSNNLNYVYTTTIWKNKSLLYGFAQCNEDLSKKDCIACITTAANYLSANFNTYSAAIAAYGSCTARFDTANFMRSRNNTMIIN